MKRLLTLFFVLLLSPSVLAQSTVTTTRAANPWFQTALTAYSSSVTYAENNYTIGSDGNAYRSLTAVAGSNPVTDDGSKWELAAVNASVTLNVPSRFTTIATALAFAKNARISTSAFVTIQVADGTYDYGSTEINLAHPYGSRIKILGNVTTPASVTINSAPVSVALFYLLAGGTFGEINGLTLVGPGRAAGQLGGIFVRGGGSVFLGNKMVIQDFYFPLYAADSSHIKADGAVVSGGGDGNLFIYNSSSMSFVGGESFGAGTYFAMAGAVVEHASGLFATGATFRDNAGWGLLVDNASTANIAGGTVTNNPGGGLKISAASTVDDTSVTYSGNTAGNVLLNGFSTTYSGWASPQSGQILTGTLAGNHLGLSFRQLSTTGVSMLTAYNAGSDNAGLYVGSASQTIRNVFGAGTGARGDLSSNGLTSFAVGTFDSAPLILGTNNTARWTLAAATGEMAGAAGSYIKFGTTTEPTCNSTNRGALVMVQGGVGVADTVRICTKDNADAYAYRALF